MRAPLRAALFVVARVQSSTGAACAPLYERAAVAGRVSRANGEPAAALKNGTHLQKVNLKLVSLVKPSHLECDHACSRCC